MLEIFQISMALLIGMTGLTAAITEENVIPALSLPIAFGTWYLIDHTRQIRIPGWVIPMLGLLAFYVAWREWKSDAETTYLNVGNHLLSYLMWVLLLQTKEIRAYWTLFALTIMQIAVTSLLTYSIWFGIALLAYLLLATWTLSIFLLQRNLQSISETDAENVSPDRSATARTSVGRSWSGVSREQHEKLVTYRFYGSTLTMSGLALMVAFAFFLLIPRIWSTPRIAKAGAPPAPLTGFSTEVRLGEMGEILESNDNVMEVRVFDAATGNALDAKAAQQYLGADPLFRGAVLEDYKRGRWHRPVVKTSRRIEYGNSSAQYKLRIALAPLHTEAIFSFGNTVGAEAVQPRGAISWDYFSGEMGRGEETNHSREFTYDLFTQAGLPDQWLSHQRLLELSGNNRHSINTPALFALNPRKFTQTLTELTRLPGELDDLYPITQRVIGNATQPLEKARRINDWLTSSGEFSYTMKMTVSDSSIDPILDFLENRRSGHCEYFASAMATMLRCADIPSRLITGFKGGMFNEAGGFLQVQQYHAHAWVEAYIDGRWVTFDPTPGDREDAVQGIEGRPATWLRTWRNMESVWHRYSIFSRESQQEKIYSPIMRRALEARDAFQELMQGRTGKVKSMLSVFASPERWFTVEGGVVILLVLLLIATVAWLIRRIYKASRTIQEFLKTQASAAAVRQLKVPFYERLVSLLKSMGLTPTPAQTAREFVLQTIPDLNTRLGSSEVGDWPNEVVDDFYRVRFGKQELSAEEARELDQRLTRIEEALKNGQDSKH